ncbi:MAG: tRNA-binding protein [Fibrella sp.]|nr:tRNA-binding protein [Armatimonadota bacterium]
MSNDPKAETSAETFFALDIRKGTVVRAEINAGANKPAYRLWVDFGDPIGVRQSSAQLTRRYSAEGLVGTPVLGVLNFPARRIAGFRSEVLILGTFDPNDPGDVILVRPDADCADGYPLG